MKDGGPAFPFFDGLNQESRGMSLRDYFAAQFMWRAQSLCESRDGGWQPSDVARLSYEMAAAMLAERECGTG